MVYNFRSDCHNYNFSSVIHNFPRFFELYTFLFYGSFANYGLKVMN